MYNPKRYDSLPIGVIIRKQPGLTRWQKWYWAVISVVPGATQSGWRQLRQDKDFTDYLAGSAELTLYGTETAAYVEELGSRTPSVYLILRATDGMSRFEIVNATLSPYEAQDYADNGEDIVEKVAMPDDIFAWVRNFIDKFHNDEPFVKRQRNRMNLDQTQDGIGDPRVQKAGDIYASPTLKRQRLE